MKVDNLKLYLITLDTLPKIFVLGLVFSFIFSIFVQLALVVESIFSSCNEKESCSVLYNQLAGIYGFSNIFYRNSMLFLSIGPIIISLSTIMLIFMVLYRSNLLLIEVKVEKNNKFKANNNLFYVQFVTLLITTLITLYTFIEIFYNSSLFQKDDIIYISIIEEVSYKFPIGFKKGYDYIRAFLIFSISWVLTYFFLYVLSPVAFDKKKNTQIKYS
ncbi:MAG: hypothetical protein QXF76_00480 [Candidatus Anstonellales archaeon]